MNSRLSNNSSQRYNNLINDSIIPDKNAELQLFNAAQNGDLTSLNLLLEKGVNVNSISKSGCAPLETSNGCTPLQVAIKKGHATIVKALLRKGAQIDPRYPCEEPLAYAIEYNQLDIVNVLLDEGARISFSDLRTAAKQRKIEIFQALLSRGKINSGLLSECILHAVKDGDPLIVKILIEHGADVKHAFWSVQSLLYIAAERGHLEVVKILLNNGVKALTDDKAIYFAAINGYVEIVKALIEDCFRSDPTETKKILISTLNTAIDIAQINVIKTLLKFDVDLNATDDKGNTPLRRAILKNNLEIVRLLIHNGADKTKIMKDKTINAELKKQPDIAQFLKSFKKPLPKSFSFSSKNKYAIIRYWEPKYDLKPASLLKSMWGSITNHGRIGHISLLICEEDPFYSYEEMSYASHWPKKPNSSVIKKFSAKSSLIHDILEEKGRPDKIIILHSLDTNKIIERLNNNCKCNPGYNLFSGTNKWKEEKIINNDTGNNQHIEHNCSSLVYDLLVAGGLFDHLLDARMKLLSGTPIRPDQVIKLAEEASHIEDILYEEKRTLFNENKLIYQNIIETLKHPGGSNSKKIQVVNWFLQNLDLDSFYGLNVPDDFPTFLYSKYKTLLDKQLADDLQQYIEIAHRSTNILTTYDENGYNALHLAIINGNYYDIRNLLIKYHASVNDDIQNSRSNNSSTFFNSQLFVRDLGTSNPKFDNNSPLAHDVKIHPLVESPDPLEWKTSLPLTPLDLAIDIGNDTIIKLLLNYNAHTKFRSYKLTQQAQSNNLFM